MKNHLGLGLAAAGVRSAAARDGAGVGVSIVGLHGSAIEEWVGEVYYATPVSRAITIVPDLAVVRHAGGDAARGTRAALNLRVLVTPGGRE